MVRRNVHYGVFLNIHPSIVTKRVTIHKLPCSAYKQHQSSGLSRGKYTFHKDCRTFSEAIKRASDNSLEWHAPISVCKKCIANWRLE